MPNRGEQQRTGGKYELRALEIAAKVVYPHGVEWTIKAFKPYKAPGTVGIYLILLQEGFGTLLGS